MSTLNFTYTLTAGQPEDIGDVQQNFTDVRTWANGNVDNTNITANSLTDSSFAASAGMYSAYRALSEGSIIVANDAAANTYLFGEAGLGGVVSTVAFGLTLGHAPVATYLDDADFAIAGRTTKLRLRAQAFVNNTAPAITFTVGLHEVTSVGGGGGADTHIFNVGAAVAGSTVAFASPSLNTRNQGNSGDFNVPADGHYVFCVITNGTIANNSGVILRAQLQQHWV